MFIDGDAAKCEIGETKFLGYLRLLDTILGVNLTGDEDDHNEKNEEAYAELVQFLDDKSMS